MDADPLTKFPMLLAPVTSLIVQPYFLRVNFQLASTVLICCCECGQVSDVFLSLKSGVNCADLVIVVLC